MLRLWNSTGPERYKLRRISVSRFAKYRFHRTACPNSVLAPLRKTSVSGSENVPGWVSWKTLVSVMAYHSFGGEVEALNTPTIRRLTLPCRHQLSALAPGAGHPLSCRPRGAASGRGRQFVCESWRFRAKSAFSCASMPFTSKPDVSILWHLRLVPFSRKVSTKCAPKPKRLSNLSSNRWDC